MIPILSERMTGEAEARDQPTQDFVIAGCFEALCPLLHFRLNCHDLHPRSFANEFQPNAARQTALVRNKKEP